MSTDDLDAKCRMPGTEGSMWRLVRQWSPNGVPVWLEGEIRLGTPPMSAIRAMAEVTAGAVFGFAINMSDPPRVMWEVQDYVRNSLAQKMHRQVHKRTPSGVFLPPDTLS